MDLTLWERLGVIRGKGLTKEPRTDGDRDTASMKHRDRNRKRVTDRKTGRTVAETQPATERERQICRDRHRQTNRGRQTQTQNKDKDRTIDRKRQKQAETQTDKDTDT